MKDIIRLDKFLADAGTGTRSIVKQYIKKGRVEVNGEVVKAADTKVDTTSDIVCFDGRRLYFCEYVYYMLNKPAGCVSATADKKQTTVVDLIEEPFKKKELFPVGRLDKDTTGLLLITNDGALAHELLSPAKHVDKQYHAVLDRSLTSDEIRRIEVGIDIGDDKPTLPCRIVQDGDKAAYFVTITEGRYHQIKRMFEAVQSTVVKLKRLSMGSLILDENLKEGEYRQLTQIELDSLKNR